MAASDGTVVDINRLLHYRPFIVSLHLSDRHDTRKQEDRRTLYIEDRYDCRDVKQSHVSCCVMTLHMSGVTGCN